jgi:thiol-disulfide isomerase/thioredoxin
VRRHRLQLALLLAALIAATAGAYFVQRRATQPDDAATRLFATRLDDSNGKVQALAQWRGKTLVINFWASWCAPCRREIPRFSLLNDRYWQKGVQFVGIAIDTAPNVRRFSLEHPVSYPLLVADAGGAELLRQLGNTQLALPYTFVLGPRGEVLLTRLGDVSAPELDALLAAQPPEK